jgi:two-component system nitrogen regulation response regulator NtrX
MIMVPRPTIGVFDLEPVLEDQLPVEPLNSSKVSNHLSFRQARALFEKDLISRRLKENGWNISKTAEDLQIERSHLHRKIKLLGIEVRPEND